MYFIDSTKVGTKRVFSFQQKLSYLFFTKKYKSSKGCFFISMRMQIFRVMKPLCTILKTKNCVPFEVQYYTCIERRVENSYVDTPDARKPLDFIFF